ncbi:MULTISPECIES: DUF1127 domain-containing protein [unclassified Xanthobacter]|uniref:DUF1127 domain-containing protein n=1 Tax=unclassified Xanthobacter TaxID=2623496 RepID=UPI001EDCB39C|nr:MULTISPECIES: DUF1127 domain-containing protein [unclassified Xanthobacter]
MASVTADMANIHHHGFLARIGTAMVEFFGAVAEARRMADRYEDLAHLSNSELEQMGLKQEDIPQVVVFGHH